MMVYGYCTKICEHFAPNFGGKRTGCCITTTHHLTLPFSPGNFFTKNNMTVFPHPSHFFLFFRVKIKLKGSHFHTTEVTKAESQAVLNTFTDHDFQDGIKKHWEWWIHAKRTTLGVMVAGRNKVSF
jgi:hypothetical protein